MAAMVMDRPELLGPLFQICSKDPTKIADRAAWLIDHAARQNLSLIYPHINEFINTLKCVHTETSIRSLSTLCEMFAQKYFGPNPDKIKELLNNRDLQTIVTISFDWLIGDHKVASKAHSMESLYWCGLKYDWIHPELYAVLERDYPLGSAGYQARARKIMNRIRTLEHP